MQLYRGEKDPPNVSLTLVWMVTCLGLMEMFQEELECRLHCVAIQDFLLDSCCLLEANVRVSAEIYPLLAFRLCSSSFSVVARFYSGPSDLQKAEGLVWVERVAVFQFASRSSSCMDLEVLGAYWRGV